MAIISAGKKGQVKSGSTNVREGAGTGFNRIYYANANDIVTVITGKSGTDGKWWMQVTNDTQPKQRAGWIREDTVNEYNGSGTNPGGGTGGIAIGDVMRTTKQGVNFRKGANSSDVHFQIPITGTVVGACSGIETAGGYNWYRTTYNGATGYLRSDCVEKNSGTGGTTVAQKIAAFSNANPGLRNWATYKDRLNYYAKFGTVLYIKGGATPSSVEPYFSHMCCAHYPYHSRGAVGGQGATSEYDSHMAYYDGGYLRGKISSLGGYDALVPGMEIFYGSDTTKEHMGVYASKYNFGSGLVHAVYQSCSSRNSISAAYAAPNGPNLTSMHANWTYWGWSKHIRL